MSAAARILPAKLPPGNALELNQALSPEGTMSDQKLQAYFNFGDADLSGNRNGVLSQKQMARWKDGKKLIIARAEGRANTVLSTSNCANIHQELQIGGKRFIATTILADILQGQEYVVYYVDRSKEHPYDMSYLHPSEDILSAELLANAGAASGAASTEDAAKAKILDRIQKGDMNGAIKLHRAAHDSSFEEAKKAVEMLKAGFGD
jgi:hypothetical protein